MTRQRNSESVKRGRILQKVRNLIAPHDNVHRSLQADSSNDPIISFKLNDHLTLSFDFNFGGDGNKELLFGLHFDFDSGIESEQSIQNMMRVFLRDAIGDNGRTELGGFSFADTALELADDLINSLVLGIHVKLDVQFGLDLGNVFNMTAKSRLPSPFLKLNTFDVDGYFGVNEWSTTLELDVSGVEFELRIADARALFSIKAGITSDEPLLLESPQDFLSIMSPTNDNGIGLNASLEVFMPVFVVVFDSLGYGATITYKDDNILDNATQTPSFLPDVLISIDSIKEAANTLAINTAFLENYEPLQQKIPLLQVSVNDFIAGQGRTIADLFDLTDFANNLVGQEIASGMPSSSPSISVSPSAIPSEAPTAVPTKIPTKAPSGIPTQAPQPQNATPTNAPTSLPSPIPTRAPTSLPSPIPTKAPTEFPTTNPTTSMPASPNKAYIQLTELLSKLRAKFQELVTPNTPANNIPPVPDTNQFNVARPAGAICGRSDSAIMIDILREDFSTLNLTICALLEFELDGSFDASGLLSAVEDSLDVDLSGSFTLKGALMFGARLSIVRNNTGNTTSVNIDFDPISVELAVISDLNAIVSFGMLTLEGNGKVDMFGKAEVVYCPSCIEYQSSETHRNFSRVNTSSFYFDRLFGYSIDSSIALNADVPDVHGVELGTGLTLSISDGDVFDNIPPTIIIPTAQALKDLLKFSPENALVMLRLIDSEYTQKYMYFCFQAAHRLAHLRLGDFLLQHFW